MKEKLTVAQLKEQYDWIEACEYMGNLRVAYQCSADVCRIDDIAKVIMHEYGENDGPSWLLVGRLKDGRYFFLEAGCDYTGWDCQASGDIQVADSLDNLKRYCMTESARERLGIKL